jgi:hypothetical protein
MKKGELLRDLFSSTLEIFCYKCLRSRKKSPVFTTYAPMTRLDLSSSTAQSPPPPLPPPARPPTHTHTHLYLSSFISHSLSLSLPAAHTLPPLPTPRCRHKCQRDHKFFFKKNSDVGKNASVTMSFLAAPAPSTSMVVIIRDV